MQDYGVGAKGYNQGVLDALAANPAGAFMVPAGDLGFSVIIFSAGATMVLGGVMLRRKLYGAELGGPKCVCPLVFFFFLCRPAAGAGAILTSTVRGRAYLFASMFILTWFTYVTLSILKTYGTI